MLKWHQMLNQIAFIWNFKVAFTANLRGSLETCTRYELFEDGSNFASLIYVMMMCILWLLTTRVRLGHFIMIGRGNKIKFDGRCYLTKYNFSRISPFCSIFNFSYFYLLLWIRKKNVNSNNTKLEMWAISSSKMTFLA